MYGFSCVSDICTIEQNYVLIGTPFSNVVVATAWGRRIGLKGKHYTAKKERKKTK